VSKLRKPIRFETTFDTYVVDELLGEGGAGRVYGGIDGEGSPVAVKLLARERVTSDRRRRFKKEIAFLSRNRHANIVNVIDNGMTLEAKTASPFYVMRRYEGSLRDLMRDGIPSGAVLPLFSQILDGIEAAHLKGVIHRDLKPENILHDRKLNNLAIADFGTARFTEDLVPTVQTAPGQRLANFQYAAPEQRSPGSEITSAADIYALGLMLNEMFTGAVPHGTDPKSIASVEPKLAFLDGIVAKMLRQTPGERPGSIAEVKHLIERHMAEAVSLQKLSQIDGTVIKSTEVDEPLAETPPKLIGAGWDGGILTLTLDRPVTPRWVFALQRMRSFASVLGKDPHNFNFSGAQATVRAGEHEVQAVIDNFKAWLPMASSTLKAQLQEAAQRDEATRRENLRREKEAEEQRLRVTRSIRI
jgi:serine/threonine protein kinase